MGMRDRAAVSYSPIARHASGRRAATLILEKNRSDIITDCCATTSAEGHKSATEGTFGMFSSPMTGEEFLKKINA